MIINNVSREISRIIRDGDYEPIITPIGDFEIPICQMTKEEKAIYTMLERCEDFVIAKFLLKRLNNSFRRLGKAGNYHCRQGFEIVVKLDLSRLIWRPYTPSLN